jgi:hypothetical protein
MFGRAALSGRAHRSPVAAVVVAVAVVVAHDARAAEPASRTLEAEQGVVCRLPGERLSYFGWPTVARLDDGRLVVVSSGLRAEHVCPFGKTVLHESRDDGRTWSESRVIRDSLIDDRDAGVVSLGGESLLVTWFRSDTRHYADEGWIPAAERETWAHVFKTWTDAQVEPLVGSWAMRSDDGGATWGEPVRSPVSAPHGPIRLADGDLFYLGKSFATWNDRTFGPIAAARSSDGGHSWRVDWILRADGPDDDLGYPSTVELADGSLVTVCYQKAAKNEKCSLLWSKWKLPPAEPAQPVAIGSRRELFVDGLLIDHLNGATLKLHEPVSAGTAITIDKPWEGPANGGMSVIELDGRLLLYYRGWPTNDAQDENGVGCVAESRDGGATWTKPALDLVRRADWPGNNIIATSDGEPRFSFPCAPFVDTRPGVPPSERVKMIESVPVSGAKHTAMTDPAGPKRLVFWASADGFTFRKLDPQPVHPRRRRHLLVPLPVTPAQSFAESSSS